MPFVRIDLSQAAPAELASTVSEVVYEAMVQVANVPQHDKFQVITRHAGEELIYPAEGYLGNKYSPNIIFIQVTWVAGRSVDVKKAFYRKIADDLHARAGVRKEDVWINLVDSKREDWSFGGGDMQYAPTE
jgi:4-oxalocrotonate tautomerase